MRRLKILIAGPFNAGKTRFVTAACGQRASLSEHAVTGSEMAIKGLTTVALDFGQRISQNGTQLLLFGAPGQDRFAFGRERLARGAQGCVLVVDSSDPASFPDARKQLQWFLGRPIHLVVAANKQDCEGAVSADALRMALDLPEAIAVLECAAVEPDSVIRVLKALEAEIG